MNATKNAIAHLKAALPIDKVGKDLVLPYDQTIACRPYAEGLIVSYVVDTGKSYTYIQNLHLEEDGIDLEQLHTVGIENLMNVAAKRDLRVQPHQNIFAVLMGGDFEASLLMVDQLWESSFRQFVEGEYAAAVPARDILAFCDSGSSDGIAELHQLISRITPGGDHLLSSRVFVRKPSAWIALNV
jgi:uncharacterized protein YtpQ (UPF0354 family)